MHMKVNDIPKGLNHTPVAIIDAYVKAKSVLEAHENGYVAVSGGRDSDIMLDILWHLAGDQLTYVWFDTGLEWDATLRHLAYLENRYGIEIRRVKAYRPVAWCVKEYGQPFISKLISHMIDHLQRKGFTWNDEPLEDLVLRYPTIRSYLKWWCDDYRTADGGVMNQWNICRHNSLKQFLMTERPSFRISDRCCYYAKKRTSELFAKSEHWQLSMTGVRQSEGGVRAIHYSGCYNAGKLGVDMYRPVFWFRDEDERVYADHFELVHSDCYKQMGFRRTGCVGCPFNSHYNEELESAERFEPAKVKAARAIFGDSYRYTEEFKRYRDLHHAENRRRPAAVTPEPSV